MTAPVLTRPSPMRQGPESPAQSAKLHSESGFTLAEMLVMAFVMAVCLAIAYPRLRGSWMAASLRSDAQGLEISLQKARSMAAATGKPARLVLDCSRRSPCAHALQAPILEGLEVASWKSLRGERKLLRKEARPIAFPEPEGFDGERQPPGIFWAIFLPDGRVLSNPRPFSIAVRYHDRRPFQQETEPGDWLVTIAADTGRALAAMVEK